MKAFVSGCSSHVRRNFVYLLRYGETARSDCYHVNFCVPVYLLSYGETARSVCYHVSFCVLLAYCYISSNSTSSISSSSSSK
jgi:hypothetical protein